MSRVNPDMTNVNEKKKRKFRRIRQLRKNGKEECKEEEKKESKTFEFCQRNKIGRFNEENLPKLTQNEQSKLFTKNDENCRYVRSKFSLFFFSFFLNLQ